MRDTGAGSVENAGCGKCGVSGKCGSVENAELVENAGSNYGKKKPIRIEQGACLLENCSILKRVFSLQPTLG